MQDNQLNILFVDDDSAFLKMTQESLKSAGHTIKTATDSAQALSIILNEIIHIVFIDCILFPDDGVTLLKKIREYVGDSVEIVMMSGIVSSDSIKDYTDRKVCRFLRKPLKASDMNPIFSKVTNKLFYGNGGDGPLKYFEENLSKENKLKSLLAVNTAGDCEFLLILSVLCELNESLTVKFGAEKNRLHTLLITNGVFSDYTPDCVEALLNKLPYIAHLTEKQNALKELDPSQIKKILINAGLISPHQFISAQTDCFFESLKSLMGKDIFISIDLSKIGEDDFHITRSDFGDKVFSFPKAESLLSFQQEVKKLKGVCAKFSEENSYLPFVKNLHADMKSGGEISEIEVRGKNRFSSVTELYAGLLHIFLKGGISIKNTSSEVLYSHLEERYKSLDAFLKNHDPKTVFQLIDPLYEKKMYDLNQVKKTCRAFISYNHPDKLPKNVSATAVKHIHSVLALINEKMSLLTNPESKDSDSKKIQKDKFIKELHIQHKLKQIQTFFENDKYQEGFDTLSEVPEDFIDKNVTGKLLYLWASFKNPAVGTDKDKKEKYFRDINTMKSKLRKSSLYFHVLGLFYLTKKTHEKALDYFKQSKTLDFSFTPAQKELKNLFLQMSQKKSGNKIPFNLNLMKKKGGGRRHSA